MRKTFAAVETEKDSGKRLTAIKKFEVAIKEFDSKETAYEKILLTAMDTADAKNVKPELDILWKQLHALSATMKSQAKAAEVTASQVGGMEFWRKH